MTETDTKQKTFWNTETYLIIILIILAIASRLVDLGARTMSHDEINHVVPAYDYFQGRVYKYDPVTHGPFQFHMMAFSPVAPLFARDFIMAVVATAFVPRAIISTTSLSSSRSLFTIRLPIPPP